MRVQFLINQNIYVFVWLQGLSTIPDVTHAATSNQTNTAEEHHSISGTHSLSMDQQDADDYVLYINSEGGIISGSVGSLNRFITPHYRRLSRTSTTTNSSTSSESSNIHNNSNLNKPTEVIFLFSIIFLKSFFV